MQHAKTKGNHWRAKDINVSKSFTSQTNKKHIEVGRQRRPHYKLYLKKLNYFTTGLHS